MTWAERVGDLARTTALTGINFLRLFTVGVLEDEPLYHGSSFLTLEIVE